MEYIAILVTIGLKRAISLKIQENRTEPKLKGNTIGNKGGKAATIGILSSYCNSNNLLYSRHIHLL